MRIRVLHETIYRYEQPARGLIQVMRMTPRDHDGQYVRRWRIEPSVDGRVSEREDGFGNVVHWFTADEPAEALSIRVTGEVDTLEMHGIVREEHREHGRTRAEQQEGKQPVLGGLAPMGARAPGSRCRGGRRA